MANAHRGEVSFKTPDAEYILVLSTNALCELEGQLGKSVPAIVVDLERLTTLRAVLWAALRTRQPDITLVKAGEIMDSVGMVKTTEAITGALNAAFPKSSKDGSANP